MYTRAGTDAAGTKACMQRLTSRVAFLADVGAIEAWTILRATHCTSSRNYWRLPHLMLISIYDRLFKGDILKLTVSCHRASVALGTATVPGHKNT